jgi:mannitol 2-dehydrogenase
MYPVNLKWPNALAQLKARGCVGLPDYDRNEVRPGILHFGVGNFFRSHVATYIDDVLDRGVELDWGIVGVNVVPKNLEQRAENHRRALMVCLY